MSPFWWPTADFVPFEEDPPAPAKGIPCPIWVPDIKDESQCAYCEDVFDDHTEVAKKRGRLA